MDDLYPCPDEIHNKMLVILVMEPKNWAIGIKNGAVLIVVFT